MTKTWNDLPNAAPCAVAPRPSAEELLLAALKDGPAPTRSVRALLSACGVTKDEADAAICALGRTGRIKLALEYNLTLV